MRARRFVVVPFRCVLSLADLLIRRPRLAGPCRLAQSHVVANEQVGIGVELGQIHPVRRRETPPDPIVG